VRAAIGPNRHLFEGIGIHEMLRKLSALIVYVKIGPNIKLFGGIRFQEHGKTVFAFTARL